MDKDKDFSSDSEQPEKDLSSIDHTIDLAEFASSAVEELQFTLDSVNMFTEILTSEYKDGLNDKAQEYLEYISDSGSRMQELIEDLSVYSLAAEGKQTWAAVDLNQIIEQVKLELQVEILESGTEIICTDFPQLLMNPIDIFQLWQNLIENAIKYHGGKNPKIKVTVELQPREWLFAVEDNGIGISAKCQSQIFDIFQRLHPADIYPGNGLGLAICQKIVRRYGGNIWFKSELGKGSTFYFTLPIDTCPRVPLAIIK